MNNTYAITLTSGKVVFINASSARQARIVWLRANNESIAAVKVCRA